MDFSPLYLCHSSDAFYYLWPLTGASWLPGLFRTVLKSALHINQISAPNPGAKRRINRWVVAESCTLFTPSDKFELLLFVKLIKKGDSYTEGALLLGWTKA